jgi:hypothetical protein
LQVQPVLLGTVQGGKQRQNCRVRGRQRRTVRHFGQSVCVHVFNLIGESNPNPNFRQFRLYPYHYYYFFVTSFLVVQKQRTAVPLYWCALDSITMALEQFYHKFMSAASRAFNKIGAF